MLPKWIRWLDNNANSLPKVFTLRMYDWMITGAFPESTNIVAQEGLRKFGELFNVYIEICVKYDYKTINE